MNLYLFLSALRARFGVFALLLAVTVLTAGAVSVLLPKTYTATVSLLVDAKDEQSLSSALRPLVLPQERVSYLETQMDILASARVARKVVRELNLPANRTARAAIDPEKASAGPIEDRLVEYLLKKIKVETSQSSVMRLSFSSPDPAYSAAIANAFAKAYIDTMLELRVEPMREAAAWFDDQLKTLRANLQDAQAKLTDYYRRRGIVSADEHFDVENTRLGGLSDQVVKAQEQTLLWTTQAQQAREFLEHGESVDRLPEVLDNPFIQKLKTDLLHGEAKLQELATQYGPNYPQYRRQVSENESLREKLEAETKKVLAGIESSLRQSREREANVRKAMAAQRARVLEQKEDRNELTVLKSNVESAARAYDTAMQRYVVSQVDSRANQTNVTILNPAAVPQQPSHPRIILNIALSVVVGTMLGVGGVILMEMFDRRVRLRSDLELDVPLLGVLNEWRPAVGRLLGRRGGPRPALPKPG